MKFARIQCQNELIGKPNSGKPKRIIVDGESLIYHLYSNKVEFSFGGQNDAFIMLINEFAEKMKKANFNMLVVFGGVPTDEGDLEAALEKNTTRVQTIAELVEGYERVPFKRTSSRQRPPCLHPLARTVLIETLVAQGIKCRHSDGDQHDTLIAMVQKHKCFLLSHDSDYIFRNIPGLIRMASLTYKEDGTIWAQIIRPASLAEKYGLTVDQLPLLATACGTPSVPFYHLYIAHHHLCVEANPTAVVEGEDAPEEGVATQTDLLPTIIAELIRGGMGQSELFAMLADKQLLARPDIVLDEEGNPVADETPEEELSETEREKRRVLALPDAERHELTIAALTEAMERYNVEIAHLAKLEKVTAHSMPFYEAATGLKVPKPLQTAYLDAVLDSRIISLLMHGTFWISPCLEDDRAEPAAHVSRKIRQLAYGVLLGDKTEVTEACRVGTAFVTEKVTPITTLAGKTLPTIDALEKHDVSRRMKMFLTAMGADPAQFKTLAPEDILPAAVLRFLVSEGKVTPEATLALLEQLCHPTDHWEHIRAAQVKRTREGLHVGAVWQQALLSASVLSQCLGFVLPAETRLGPLFDGAGVCWSLDDISQERGLFYNRRSDIYSTSELRMEEQDAADGFTIQNRESRKKAEEAALLVTLERARKIYQAATAGLKVDTIADKAAAVAVPSMQKSGKQMGSKSSNRFMGLEEEFPEYSDDE
ncbi:hypothetical protein J8273_3109 [Carpediemonas membranifera]|uniref:Asteroid domain-containing protein n=1 Tax=Carpediemonas membranifera TaxID=201153 RepID=A0A8J6AVX9_9EUKA|nr:hypothetical protein J8273_3109 [Carpediemonas membranifera]|eukprot:KAG9395533.1 hypothetical protein J8273_3109 [Carpediemonas membranifera]